MHASTLVDCRRLARRQDDVILRRQALPLGLTASQWRDGAGGVLRPLLSGGAVLALADGLRESPFESRAALRFHRAGLGDVRPQVEISLGSRRVRVDFLVDGRVVVECDGRAFHDDVPTRYADRERHEALERAGFVVVRITWLDLMRDTEKTMERIRLAVLDARRRVFV